MFEISIGGSFEEIGRARARELKSAIFLSLEHFLTDHRGKWGLNEAKDWGLHCARDLERRFPELLREIGAMASELGLEESICLAFNFRAWNALSPHPTHLACYNISFKDPRKGVLLGGVIDDTPPFYVVEHVRPQDGFGFHSITWAGTVWTVRGMNEKGLAVGQVSAFLGQPLERKGKITFGTDDFSRSYFALRKALQFARTVNDAIEVVASFPCVSTFMFADARGDAAVLEKAKNRYAVRRKKSTSSVLIGGVHFSDPGILKGLISDGIHPAFADVSLARKRWVESFVQRHIARLSLNLMKEILTSHEPDAHFCSDFSQAATVAAPQAGEFWVAGYRACRTGFKKFLTRDLKS